MDNYAERLCLFTLSQICCRQEDRTKLIIQSECDQTTSHSDYEEEVCPFLPPGPTEFGKILWINGEAVGFYTVKQKGTENTVQYMQKWGLLPFPN